MRKLACVLLGSMLGLSLLAAACVAGGQDTKQPKKITINIKLKDMKYLYVKDGDEEQKDVVVLVGQTVIWKNLTKMKHSSTSNKDGADGKPLFKKVVQKQGEQDDSAEQLFDKEFYEKKAGGKPGGQVTLDYYCEYHDNQQSRLILKDAGPKKK